MKSYFNKNVFLIILKCFFGWEGKGGVWDFRNEFGFDF